VRRSERPRGPESRNPGSLLNGQPTLFPPTKGAKGSQLHINYLSALIRVKMDEAGIDRMRSSGHRLRHPFATNFVRAGGNVIALQRLLGHSSLAMTRRYITLVESDLAEAARKASPVDRMALWG